MPPIGVSLMAQYGLDLSNHVSRQVTAGSAAEAEIILGLSREHVREVVAMAPEAWPKTFTLKDFVRRVERVGPRRRHQRVTDWLVTVGADREPYQLLGADPEDDVIDPYGRHERVWQHVVDEIDDLVRRIVPTLGTVARTKPRQ
jgi:protein-tyrosine-phosphatase